MSRHVLIAAAVAATALAAGTSSASSRTVSCESFSYHGYRASSVHGTGITCQTVRGHVEEVIDHGVGPHMDRGWTCLQSSSTDGSGHAGCEVLQGRHKFSFHYRPL